MGWEDPLEEGTATHSSILAWRISWTEKLTGGGPQGRKELDMTEGTGFFPATCLLLTGNFITSFKMDKGICYHKQIQINNCKFIPFYPAGACYSGWVVSK